ncbi:uncharacterized protein MELLADRAFT_109707 [Melampsora larici-populina 98AG31]|uniref:Uncharacterized protein n=1 Tax=Melampsora larici-populina (strain 98AG31 / pathotype 3-4-7) TaxID=747676 RepID=F4RXC8_MELLP|nr:uncharacterized protein MELLADRAFT_109707 [Melampsora larici-populina 98AG31]EGG02942.1 hypothetical protein MELLADRAFT_109707 [Melampsora larici-populina 98AG31]
MSLFDKLKKGQLNVNEIAIGTAPQKDPNFQAVPGLPFKLFQLRETHGRKVPDDAPQESSRPICSKFGIKDLDILKAEMCPDMHLDSSTIAFTEDFDILEKIVPSLGNRVVNACKTLDNYTYNLINERPSKEDKNDEGPEDLLDFFMKAEDQKGTPLNQTNTTAQALSWAFFHLIMNPGMIDHVQKDISKMDQGAKSGMITYSNYRQFFWTQAVLCEALRLHPSVPKDTLH